MLQETVIKGDKLSLSQNILLIIEGLILLIITVAFWYHIDPNQSLRDAWYWLLWSAVPIFALRLILFRRLWTHTPLHNLMLLFVLIALFNYNQSLYQRESFLAPMARPLFGMWLCIYLIEVANAKKRLREVIIITLGMTFCLSILALTASQWLESKTGILWSIIQYLPQFDYRETATAIDGQFCSPLIDLIHSYRCFNPGIMLRNSLLSFNVNEIAGVLSWLTPLMAGFALIRIGHNEEDTSDKGRFWFSVRVVSAILFVLLFIALLFGQSRFAILGVIITLALLALVAIPDRTWRYVALCFVGLIALLQAGILFNFITPTSIDETSTNETVGLSGRDANSVETRLAIWQRSLEMMQDRPLSGMGMYMFRTAVNREPYRIPHYVDNDIPPPPHAHNEWLNIGAEMGVLGLLVYMAWQLVIVWMLWFGWRHGDTVIRGFAIAVGAGLLAHALYGLGDTIALWDRFQFILWWLFGLVGAAYVLAQYNSERPKANLYPTQDKTNI